jgi:amino acid transporter
VEICWRNPDGGGVVSVATQAFTPLVGCIGGLLISVDYFLTSAISSVSGMHYLSTILPSVGESIVLYSVIALALLAAINIIGIRESAAISLVMAVAAFVMNVVVVSVCIWDFGPEQWQAVRDNLMQFGGIAPKAMLIGFSGAWLAFSGLESISQLSPAMKLPIPKVAGRGMFYVVLTMVVSAPLLTLFSVALLPEAVKIAPGQSERFISELAAMFGGRGIEFAVVVTASSLLLFAANTAIIGGYHVFLALEQRGFMPSVISSRSHRFGTPTLAIIVATLVPMIVIKMAHGDMDILGSLYAFGLLGCFVLSSAGLDVIRWRDGVRGWKFAIGVFTTIVVAVAWGTNIGHKQDATFFGCLIVLLGLVLAVGTRRKWFSDLLYQIPFIQRKMPERIHDVEEAIEQDSKSDIMSLAQAESLVSLYPSATLVAIRSGNAGLIAEAITRERGQGGRTIYVAYIEERTGLFVGSADYSPKIEGVQALKAAVQSAPEDVMVIPVWTVSYNAVEGIARAAEMLGVNAVMIGVSQRTTIYHLLRGHVLAGLTKRLPPGIRLLIYG